MELIFVYNAKSGLKNHLMDALHKSFSPSTYSCDLCSLTYGHVSPRKEWTRFLKSSNFKKEFMYSDKFQSKFPNEKFEFPVILAEEVDGLKVLVSANEMHEVKDVKGLIEKIKQSF